MPKTGGFHKKIISDWRGVLKLGATLHVQMSHRFRWSSIPHHKDDYFTKD